MEEIHRKFLNGQVHSAKADIDAYLEHETESAYAWLLLGLIDTELDADSTATLGYERALKLNPEMTDAWVGLGILSRKAKNYSQAIEYYEQALAIDPECAGAYTSLSTVYIVQKRFLEAIHAGLKAYNMDKKNPVFAANLSIAYHYHGDLKRRDEYYANAEKLGYKLTDELLAIYSGEITFFD